MCKKQNYDEATMIDFVHWVSQQVSIPIAWQEIVFARNKMIGDLLLHEDTADPILHDPSFMQAWASYSNTKYKVAKDVWKKTLGPMRPDQRKSVWSHEVSSRYPLKPNDLDLYILSRLAQVNILLLYRSPYGKTEIGKRGDLDDLAASASFFVASQEAWKKLPCLILYRENGDQHAVYSAIVNEKDEFMHPITKNMPKDILSLLQHMFSKQT